MQWHEFAILSKLLTSIKSHFLDANWVICIALPYSIIENYQNKEILFIFPKFLEGKKRHVWRKPHAHTQTCTHTPHCTSLSHVFLPPLPLCPFWMSCLLCICKTKMSEWIRIIDSSPSTTVTDLADYFHAWQTLVSASLSAVIEHSTYTCWRQWAVIELDSYNIYWFIEITVMRHQPLILHVKARLTDFCLWKWSL